MIKKILSFARHDNEQNGEYPYYVISFQYSNPQNMLSNNEKIIKKILIF